MLLGLERTRNQVEIYNIGSEDQTRVDRPTNRGKLSVGCNLANLKDAEAEGMHALSIHMAFAAGLIVITLALGSVTTILP